MPLGSRTDFGDAKFSGVQTGFSPDAARLLESTFQQGFDFAVAPLVNPKRGQKVSARGELDPLTPQDVLTPPAEHAGQVVGLVSSWISPDRAEALEQRQHEAALSRELDWAAHNSLQAAVCPLPRTGPVSNYARTLLQFTLGLSPMALWVVIPLGQTEEGSIASSSSPTSSPGSCNDVDGWSRWNHVRSLCDHSTQVGVVLEVPASLPAPQHVRRWFAEPVKALLLPSSVFVTNRKGFPTLPKSHQALLLQFFGFGVQVILTGLPESSSEPPSSGGGGAWTVVTGSNGGRVLPPRQDSSARQHWEYLSFLFRRPEPVAQQEQMEMGYRDFLQVPLQPLQDNLESQTYEVFEKDVTKYTQYEEAILAALRARQRRSSAAEASTTTGSPQPNGHHGSTHPRNGEDSPVVIFVVGAGRGPLVRASIQAGQRAGRVVQVYAVEKNPNAVITLHRLVASQRWEDKVTVLAGDMRALQPPQQADILVSELLGSFGDNELSPECLDGAQRFLAPGGISIPAAYTSFLQPISASKIWSDARAYKDVEHMETPYVTKMHRFSAMADSLPVFSFSHPTAAQPNNARYARLAFSNRSGSAAALCHGFAGYFEATLFGDVTLSTHPTTHTPNMFSWFPIYFPLSTPVTCPAGCDIEVHIWRCTSLHKVWYEWALAQPQITGVHNMLGRSYHVGL
ncbi:hypothetical protein WJX73_003164 [Symbiochloris irregularis]|uniref:Protein arginine N-methyltransferase n=1 Tax=Symbiochloris irregularis TaxID=706552 RepID=A0AAW1NXX2_9CHLO